MATRLVTWQSRSRSASGFAIGLAIFLVCPAAHAASDFSTATQNPSPANLPAGYVTSPAGNVHESCITLVSRGDTVQVNGAEPVAIRAANGSTRALAKCNYPRLDQEGLPLVAAAGASCPPTSHAVDALLNYSPGAKGLYSSWTVPGNAGASGPIALWPGLEDQGRTLVLQPVLEWHSLEGGWYLRNWYVYSTGSCTWGQQVSSKPVQVYPGDTVVGTVTGSNCNSSTGICSTWTISETDTTRGTAPDPIVLTGFATALPNVFGGVVEIYNITNCGQLPSAPLVSFMSQYQMQNGNNINPGAWNLIRPPQTPSCYYDAWYGWDSRDFNYILYLGYWNGSPDYPLTFDAGDNRRYSGLSDWASNQYKAECGTAELVTGLSANASTSRAHSVLCSYNGPVNSKVLNPSWSVAGSFAGNDWRRDTSTGDWDYGYYKGECATNEAVTGVSQTTDGKLATLLCTRMWKNVVTGACKARVFSSGDSRGTSATGAPADWAYGFHKGQCNSPSEMVKGVSRDPTTGKAHAILCCPIGG